MTVAPDRAAPRRRRRHSRLPGRLVVLAGLVVAFIAGIAVGEALHDNPKPGGTQTLVRTLQPLPPATTVRSP